MYDYEHYFKSYTSLKFLFENILSLWSWAQVTSYEKTHCTGQILSKSLLAKYVYIQYIMLLFRF